MMINAAVEEPLGTKPLKVARETDLEKVLVECAPASARTGGAFRSFDRHALDTSPDAVLQC